MNEKIYKGFRAEVAARAYFAKKNYKIVATNYRTAFGECDLVVTDNITLVFVEVRSRSLGSSERPSASVDIKKQKTLSLIASSFIKKFQVYGVPVRFDIVEVVSGQVNHIENAFDSKI